jgi:prepilin-type processing-associated H-X9-DG protein
MANLKSIGTGVYFYAQDSNDYLMPFLANMDPNVASNAGAAIRADNNNWWIRRLGQFLPGKGVAATSGLQTIMRCPAKSGKQDSTITYGMNYHTGWPEAKAAGANFDAPIRMVKVVNPSGKVLVADTNRSNSNSYDSQTMYPFFQWIVTQNKDRFFPDERHPSDSTNYLFVDGHVENDGSIFTYDPAVPNQEDQYWVLTK